LKTHIFTALPLLALAFPATAQAEDAAAYHSDDQILVTATRHDATPDSITSSLTVLGKSALDRSQDMGVTEVLLRTPAISISRNGGYGTSTSLRIRGAESDHTVVVIDGVKLNDPAATGGGYNLAHLMLGDAAQIEVLRGPQSILWGSQAIGGVVNITTAMPTKPLEGSFDIEAGSRETVNSRLALGGQQGALKWRIGAQNFTTEGISAIAPEFGGREKDGYRNRSVRGRAEVAISDDVTFDFGGYYGAGRVEIDSTSGDTAEYATNDEWLAHAGLRFGLLDGKFQNRIMLQYTDTARENRNPARARPLSFESQGTNKRAEYQGQFQFAPSLSLIFGADFEKSEFKSRSPSASNTVPLPNFARGSAEILGLYAQFLAEPIDGLHVNAGVRHDDHNVYGGATLFGAGGRWNLGDGTSLRASYGEGFKAPSLYQLYSESGNDALSPERSSGWEAGVEQSLFGNALTLSALYFERTSKGQIVYNPCVDNDEDLLCYPASNGGAFRYGYYGNITRSETRGVETAAEVRLGAMSISGNYSWVLAEDRSEGEDDFGRWLPRRPRETANISFDYQTPIGVEVGGAVRWLGKSYDNATNRRELAGYTLVDIRAELPIAEKLRLFARVENLFDENYMTVYRYGSLGRSIYAGLRGRF
jgi:vitamin B12 transporter